MARLYAHWDLASLCFFVFLGIVSMVTLRSAKKRERYIGKTSKIVSRNYIIWFSFWVFFSVFRYVSRGIGGSDAITYIEYFEDCLNPNLATNYATHLDILFRIICKLIRLITSDYHIFFLIMYGFVTFSFMIFMNEFCLTNISFTPMVLMFLTYWYSFNTLRTSVAVGCLLLALVCYHRNKKILVIAFSVSSILIHKASIFYACFFGFLYLYKKNKFKWWHGVLWMVICALIAMYAQKILVMTDISDSLNGAYSAYAKRSLSSSFWDNAWKLAFGQLMLCGLMFIFREKIRQFVQSTSAVDQERYEVVFLLCIYDFLMIPVNYILSIWRGSQYFYLPRLIMWGLIVKVLSKMVSPKDRKLIYIGSFCLFLSWMIFRMYNTWEDGQLMPYIFEPFYNLFN